MQSLLFLQQMLHLGTAGLLKLASNVPSILTELLNILVEIKIPYFLEYIAFFSVY